MVLEVNGSLGPYDLSEQLGVGGMGFVYRAQHRLLLQPRAVKILQPHLAADETFLHLFYREARLAASLEHPGIVKVFDVGEADGHHFLAMELLDGHPLHHLLRAAGPFAPGRAAGVVRKLADALQYAHDRKVVHRDVKPANVFVDDRDRVTLLDFGIARASDGTADGTASRSGAMLGTAAYMAPELFEGQASDAFSDGYALAVLTFELLSGKTPFGDVTPQALGYAHVHRTPPPLRSRAPHLPELAERVIERELSKQPGARYPSAAAFADALVPILEAAGQLDAARTMLERQDVESAHHLVQQAERVIPRDPALQALSQTIQRRRVQMVSQSNATQMLAVGDWRSATEELNRLEPDANAQVAALRAMADALRRSEEARVEASRRAEALEHRRADVPTERPGPVTAPARPSPPLVQPRLGQPTGVQPRSVSAPPPRVSPGHRGSRRRWALVGVIGTFMLISILGGALLLRRASTGATADPARTGQTTPVRAVATATSGLLAPKSGAVSTGQSSSDPSTVGASSGPPGPPEQRLVQARSAFDAGRLDEARGIVDDLRGTSPSLAGLGELTVAVYVRQGQELAQAGRLDDALAAFEVALQPRPDNAEVLNARKPVLLQKRWQEMEAAWGKDDDALTAAEAILALDPDYRDIRAKVYALLLARADRSLAAGDRAAALADLTRAHELYPAGTEATQRLAGLTPTAAVRVATQPPAPPRPIQQAAPTPQPPVVVAPPTARPTTPPPPTPVPTRPPPPPTARPTTPPAPTPVPTRPPPPPPTQAPAPTQQQTCQQGPHVVLAGPCDVRRPQ